MFEVQITVTDMDLKKIIFDRKAGSNSLDAVSWVIRDVATAFDLTPQRDQSRQEVQYNETRGVPPTVTRSVMEGVPIIPVLTDQIVTAPDGRQFKVHLDPVLPVPTIDERNREAYPIGGTTLDELGEVATHATPRGVIEELDREG